MSHEIPGKKALKGRGALSNPAGRFERTGVESFDDGWYVEEQPDSVDTTLEPDRAKSVISRNDSPDIGFEQSINPYRGCEHACIYCYARPSHAYMGLSAGRDFETRLFYKADAAKVLESELAQRSYVCKTIMLGSNTDPYQPAERRMLVTRSILEVLARCRHPVSIVTKGALVVRDIDILSDLARDNLATVTVSITSLDPETKRTLEPRAASPQARLRAVQQLAQAGVPVGILVAPVIPALTDHEMERIMEAAVEMGALWAGYVMLRLPYEVKDLFREWLTEHHPQRASHVMSLVQDVRGGRDNDPNFGSHARHRAGRTAHSQPIQHRASAPRAGFDRAGGAELLAVPPTWTCRSPAEPRVLTRRSHPGTRPGIPSSALVGQTAKLTVNLDSRYGKTVVVQPK